MHFTSIVASLTDYVHVGSSICIILCIMYGTVYSIRLTYKHICGGFLASPRLALPVLTFEVSMVCSLVVSYPAPKCRACELHRVTQNRLPLWFFHYTHILHVHHILSYLQSIFPLTFTQINSRYQNTFFIAFQLDKLRVCARTVLLCLPLCPSFRHLN